MIILRPLHWLSFSFVLTMVGAGPMLIGLRYPHAPGAVANFFGGGVVFTIGLMLLLQSLRWTWRWLRAFWS